ncbi:hypothetical protein BG58_22400 [Caballeronia jiangsuensis]|nr:hypothetical protein BG58_22400 [Caballeronia jiangsuensis]
MVGQLVHLLLTDAMNDIEVVARELSLRDEMRERLRRSVDRLACAQSVVEAMCLKLSVDAHDDSGRDEVGPMDSVLSAMETLASEWPADYGANAVEWLLLSEPRC